MKPLALVSPVLLSVADQQYNTIDLPALFPERLSQLPVVLRILLEHAIRGMQGDERAHAVEAIFAWLEACTTEAEIAILPGRLLLQEGPNRPTLINLAAMRSQLAVAAAEQAAAPLVQLNDARADHVLSIDADLNIGATADKRAAGVKNTAARSGVALAASKPMQQADVHPPATDNTHTIDLAQLTSVVAIEACDGAHWAVPDTVVSAGCDPRLIGGIGVLNWTIEQVDAQPIMSGRPTMLRIPDVIGVRLTGRLTRTIRSSDLALAFTERLRGIGLAGDVVEFYGPGVASLTAVDRTAIANMASEYGATTAFFPVDELTLTHLRQTGFSDADIALIKAYTQQTGLWFHPDTAPHYTLAVQIMLNEIGMDPADVTKAGEP